ncbi:MAG: glutaredoxin [Gammaproteobacteria bacterium]
MTRPVLNQNRIHPAIQATVADNNIDIINEVEAAIASNDIVIVGMALNPFPKKAKKLLDGLSIEYCYLEYGGYFSLWRRRNALKLWCGWTSFPMIFVKGMLVGGATDLQALADSGELSTMLEQATNTQ